MRRISLILSTCAILGLSWLAPSAEPAAKIKPKDALQPFNDLIGSWRCNGAPEGTRAEKQKGAWSESVDWVWRFDKDDAWLKVTFDKGKYWTAGQLRPGMEKDQFELTLTTTDKDTQKFVGAMKERTLTVDRSDAKTGETQRLIFRLLHSNRYVVYYEAKPKDKELYRRLWQIGATKEGEPFAAGQTGPECIVSGGLGTMKVTHKGQTYYVCCSGCRDAFKDDPEKYIKEYEEKMKGKGK